MASFLIFLAALILLGLGLLAGAAWLPGMAGEVDAGIRWGLVLLVLGGFLLLALARGRGAVNRMVLPAALILVAAAWLMPGMTHHAARPPVLSSVQAGTARAPQPAANALPAPTPAPPAEAPVGRLSSTLRIPADRSGHFLVRGRVNGEPVVFLVDTGATRVALSEADARRAGLHPMATDFTHRVNTAHGPAMTAEANLRSVEVGPIELRDVPAIVVDSGLDVSLLGMSFLSRLSSYSVEDGVLDLER